MWVVQAGRGFGKTRAGAEATSHFLHQHPGSRVALVGPTWRDVRDTMVEGESGLLSVIPSEWVTKWNHSLGELVLKNGSRCFAYAATQPDRLRGPQHHFAWGDEVAAWERSETWDQLLLGLRLGADPRVVLTTTPRPRKLMRDILRHPRCQLSRGSTWDNLDNLPPEFAQAVLEQYRGTRLGRQEIEGELLADVEGALWTLDMIARSRVAPPEGELADVTAALDLSRVLVAIDPAGGGEDEIGIVAAGKGRDGHAYVLADRSCRLRPEGWARRAVALYEELGADAIVVERNFGGDMAAATVRAVDRGVPIREVVASRGKRMRAEPVSALYERDLVHHVGVFDRLEDQMTVWTPESGDSPDRLDALVWALSDLMRGSQGAAFLESWRAHPLPESNAAEIKAQAGETAAIRRLQRKMRSGVRWSSDAPVPLSRRCEHRWRDGRCVLCGGQKPE